MEIESREEPPLTTIHVDLLWVKTEVYDKIGILAQDIKIENESTDYGAAEFIIENQSIKFRVAKITPTKIGQFVTFWKRIGNGAIQPYDYNDSFDLLIVTVRDANQFGQFIFPKKVLYEKGVLSYGNKEGKRAIRVYPPWDKTDSLQARKTQAWQLKWFIQFPEILNGDCVHIYRSMLNLKTAVAGGKES